MLLRARIGSLRLRRFNQNFISICSEHVQRFVNELVERHCLLRFLAVHEFCAHPGRRYLKYANTAVSKQEALRQHIGVESSFCGGIDSCYSQWYKGKDRGVVENQTTTALKVIDRK